MGCSIIDPLKVSYKDDIMEKDLKLNQYAEFMITYFMNNGNPISQLKLNKLMYYYQAWHLVYFEKAKPFEEAPEAWVNGPVYPTIYTTFQSKKDVPLKLSALFTSVEDLFEEKKNALNMPKKQEELMSAVLTKYGAMNDMQLVYLTHIEAPWLEARGNISPFARSNAKISFETMYNHYKSRLESPNNN